MPLRKFCIFVLCFAMLFTLGARAQTRDPDRRDLSGISPKRHKYIFVPQALRKIEPRAFLESEQGSGRNEIRCPALIRPDRGVYRELHCA